MGSAGQHPEVKARGKKPEEKGRTHNHNALKARHVKLKELNPKGHLTAHVVKLLPRKPEVPGTLFLKVQHAVKAVTADLQGRNKHLLSKGRRHLILTIICQGLILRQAISSPGQHRSIHVLQAPRLRLPGKHNNVLTARGNKLRHKAPKAGLKV